MPKWLKTERRRWRRQWLKAPVRLITPHGAIEGFGLRVSEGGMYLFAVTDLAPGALVEIEFAKPRSHERSHYPAVVRNRLVYLYGLEFVRDTCAEPRVIGSAAKSS